MKTRLRTDLVAAIKHGRKVEATILRELIAALDNAEAPPVRREQLSLVQHDFLSGSAETEKLLLSREQVREVLQAEIETREQAAAEYARLGKGADSLLAEVTVARRYLDNVQ
nr:hypothetical protein [Mesorhizobium loti]